MLGCCLVLPVGTGEAVGSSGKSLLFSVSVKREEHRTCCVVQSFLTDMDSPRSQQVNALRLSENSSLEYSREAEAHVTHRAVVYCSIPWGKG